MDIVLEKSTPSDRFAIWSDRNILTLDKTQLYMRKILTFLCKHAFKKQMEILRNTVNEVKVPRMDYRAY